MKHLEKVVREALEKPEGVLTREDMLELEELEVDGEYFEDISPLARLTNLKDLKLEHNQISQLQVEELQKVLSNCKIPT